MAKRGAILFMIIFLAIMSCCSFTRAEGATSSLQVDSITYNIKLKSVESASIMLDVNGETRAISPIQPSQPFYANPFSPSKPELKVILEKVFVPSRTEEVGYATILIAIEKNLTEENPNTTITIDGQTYDIELFSVEQIGTRIKINGQVRTVQEQSSPPYYFNPVSPSIPELKIVLKKFYASSRIDLVSYATFLFGFEKNLTEECTENWQCGNWSVCSNGQQTRTCTDANNCSTTSTKPSETQACTESRTCTEAWSCTGWNICENGQQTRICSDINNCSTVSNKPQITQNCTVQQTAPSAQQNITPTPSQNKTSQQSPQPQFSFNSKTVIKSALIATLIVVVIIILILVFNLMKNPS